VKVNVSDQRSIIDLQNLDYQTSNLKNKSAHLPELAEINSQSIKQNNARDLRIAAETELNDVKRELARAEGDVEQIVTRIERDEKRLASGTGTPKELEQTQHELVTLGARRAELEEIELEVMMRVDEIKARITDLSGQEEQLGRELLDAQVRKENALTSINLELEKVEKERAATAQTINTEFLALYEKIRQSNNGIGAALLAGNQCKGCNLTLNTIELQRIAGLPEDEVVRCEECRCILVRDK
jgi:predicted  nucleic acid-binding Zn-ribbon protein